MWTAILLPLQRGWEQGRKEDPRRVMLDASRLPFERNDDFITQHAERPRLGKRHHKIIRFAGYVNTHWKSNGLEACQMTGR